MSPIPPSPPLYTARLLRAHSKHGLWPVRLKDQTPFWFPTLLVVVSAVFVFVSLVALDFLSATVFFVTCTVVAVLGLSAAIVLRRRN